MISTRSLALAAISLAGSAQALSSCVLFDSSWNLYVFGGSSDVGLGASPWSSISANTLPTSGRPPFTGQHLTCHLNQYNNLFYFLGADASNPNVIYIYNPAGSTWASQTTTGMPDLSQAGTILDHDTNVFFTLSGSTLYQLDFSTITSATSGSGLAWDNSIGNTPFTSSYKPTMALASNHIQFFGAPNVAAGSADIFVVHYSSFQATPQAFPTLNGGAAFPDSHGQATSFYLDSTDAQLQMAFVPDDFSNTYVLTHWTNPSTAGSTDGAPNGIANFINTTQTLPAPSSKDTSSVYAASDTTLVQLDSTGALYQLKAFASAGGYAVDSSATWSKIGYTLAGGASTSGSSSASSSASASASSKASSASMSSAKASASASKSATRASVSASAPASASASASRAASGSSKSTQTGWWGLAGSGLVGLGAILFL